jgi:hypothetical protein
MRITTMLADTLGRAIAYLPNLIAAAVILAVGLFVSKALGRLTERSLQAVGLHRRPSMQKILGEGRSLERVPRGAGRAVYWVLGLVTVGLAVDALHLAWLSAGVARVIAYLPNVLAACLVVGCGYVAGNFVYRTAARRDSSSAALMPRLARGAIFALAGFMALQQLGIATSIVTIAFTVGIAALAVAGALAFGLGNRDLAGRITREWYARRGGGLRHYDSTPARPGGLEEHLDEHHEVGVDGEKGWPVEHPHH